MNKLSEELLHEVNYRICVICKKEFEWNNKYRIVCSDECKRKRRLENVNRAMRVYRYRKAKRERGE